MLDQQFSPTDDSLSSGKRRWHKSAPQQLQRAAKNNGDPAACFRPWLEHLATRKEPVPLIQLWQNDAGALHWGLTEEHIDGRAAGLLKRVPWMIDDGDGAWGRLAEEWLSSSGGERAGAAGALQAIGWAAALPAAAASLQPQTWWRVLDQLVAMAQEASEVGLEADPLVQQVLGGELPLTLGYLFPELSACRKLLKAGRGSLTLGLTELLDGEGMPAAHTIEIFRPLLACWTRCHLIGETLEKGWASKNARFQYAWAIRAALRLSRPDGSQAFTPQNGRSSDRGLLGAALASAGDEDDRRIASLALPGGKPPKDLDGARLPSAADHSAWAAVTVLCPDWEREEPRLTVMYPQQEFRLELAQQKELLLSGSWIPEGRVDGKALRPVSSWEELCWVTDEDIDYLELGMDLSGGVRLQRHLALARKDKILLLADALLDCPGETIEYCGRLPLAPGVGFGRAEETWDGFLLGGKAAALVLPLGLPEWRVDDSQGTLAATPEALELRQHGRGRALFAPLLFDLKPRRMTGPLTWRRLTVAENRKIQPPDVAVGFRAMIGRQQWLIYRSLTAAANRTLLGHNLASELLLARFGRDGQVESLVEIEG